MKQYSVDHLVVRFNPRVWSLLLQWLVRDWVLEHETVAYTEDYYQLWSPVQGLLIRYNGLDRVIQLVEVGVDATQDKDNFLD